MQQQQQQQPCSSSILSTVCRPVPPHPATMGTHSCLRKRMHAARWLEAMYPYTTQYWTVRLNFETPKVRSQPRAKGPSRYFAVTPIQAHRLLVHGHNHAEWNHWKSLSRSPEFVLRGWTLSCTAFFNMQTFPTAQ